MSEYIDREALMRKLSRILGVCYNEEKESAMSVVLRTEYAVMDSPIVDVAPVVHGRWILEAHKDREDYRWNVTAECSECCDERKEIWSGFFYDVPDSLARDVSLISAEEVELSNYCPNCGAKMDWEG